MIDPQHVSAVLVTRGNVDMQPILDTVTAAGIADVVVWDNSRLVDYSVYGRYAGIKLARHDTIYVQDDDATLPIADLLNAYTPGERLASHDRPDYADSALVGWGALFPRNDPHLAFDMWDAHTDQRDEGFYRCCDVIFTTLLPFRIHNVGHHNLPWATARDRMYTGDADHYQIRADVLNLCRQIRDEG